MGSYMQNERLFLYLEKKQALTLQTLHASQVAYFARQASAAVL